jgi:hypothetical protein
LLRLLTLRLALGGGRLDWRRREKCCPEVDGTVRRRVAPARSAVWAGGAPMNYPASDSRAGYAPGRVYQSNGGCHRADRAREATRVEAGNASIEGWHCRRPVRPYEA